MDSWPHAPLHEFDARGTFIVTAGTLGRSLLFRGENRLELLQQTAFRAALDSDWKLQAWSFFANHYHLVVSIPDSCRPLGTVVKNIHSETARILNRMDGSEGRQVWFQYWETRLTFPKSYFARLRYVYENPVHHGLVRVASSYRWSSAAWFERHASQSFFKTVQSFRIDRVNVVDDF